MFLDHGRSKLGKTLTPKFTLPLVESLTIQNMDDKLYAPFEVNLLLNAAADQKISSQKVLANSHITVDQLDDTATRISMRQRLVVYQNILDSCDDPSIFLKAGSDATVCSFGVWGYVLLSSNTILDAIHMAFKYLKLTGPLLRKTFDIDEDHAFFEAEDILLLGPLLQPVIDFWYAFSFKTSMEISKGSFVLEHIYLTFPEPEYKSSYEAIFKCPVTFNSDRNRMCFSRHILELELPRANPLSFQICTDMCATMVREMKNISGPAKEVRDLILLTPNYFPTFKDIAGQLFMTPRTLRRKLADQGTSYQQILNETRKHLAIKFLRETNLSMDQIAERVGFSDARNFRHAFKKWTDSTPSSHRARHTVH